MKKQIGPYEIASVISFRNDEIVIQTDNDESAKGMHIDAIERKELGFCGPVLRSSLALQFNNHKGSKIKPCFKII